jgi:CheY-like chemotaxis protein
MNQRSARSAKATSDECVILVVDDDDASRNAMQVLLEMDGFRVVTAADGKEGLDYLHAGLQPMAILLDLCMPRMDGFQFRSAQAQEPKLANIPVVVYSAQLHANDRIAALKPAAYFEKPFDVDRLRLTFAELRAATGP